VKLPAQRAEHPGPFSSLTKEKIGSIIGTIVKLSGQRPGLPRKAISFYIVLLDPRLKGGACGALSGQNDRTRHIHLNSEMKRLEAL